MSNHNAKALDKRLSLVESRMERDSPRDVSGPRSSASLHDIYGGSLDRHLACLKRITRSEGIKSKSLTSLTVFQLVEMELLARDERGDIRVTPLGARALEDYD